MWQPVIAGVSAGCLGYLIGSVPAGLLLTRLVDPGLDLRGVGSGNVGTSNIYRHAGFRLAAVVGPLQFAQGWAPTVIVGVGGGGRSIQAIAALAAVVGNGWPVWLRLRGGRGVAAATGAVAALSAAGLGLLLACFVIGARRRTIAAGVVAGFCLLPLLEVALNDLLLTGIFTVLLGLLLLRRLEGIGRDIRRFGNPGRQFTDRLIHDRRPGRPLAGPRTDGN